MTVESIENELIKIILTSSIFFLIFLIVFGYSFFFYTSLMNTIKCTKKIIEKQTIYKNIHKLCTSSKKLDGFFEAKEDISSTPERKCLISELIRMAVTDYTANIIKYIKVKDIDEKFIVSIASILINISVAFKKFNLICNRKDFASSEADNLRFKLLNLNIYTKKLIINIRKISKKEKIQYLLVVIENLQILICFVIGIALRPDSGLCCKKLIYKNGYNNPQIKNQKCNQDRLKGVYMIPRNLSNETFYDLNIIIYEVFLLYEREFMM